MKLVANSDDRDDDDDDDFRNVTRTERETLTAVLESEDSNSSDNSADDTIPIQPLSAPLLLKSRIHAGGIPVVHELARGVPGFWGPPASHVALYSVLTEVLS